MITRNTIPEIRFDEADARAAFDAWGCNCGPAALAAVLGLTLDEVRPFVEYAGFADKRYTNPTMMQDAIRFAGATIGKRWTVPESERSKISFPHQGLARIQWTGPWSQPGASVRWKYRQSHWVACWRIGEGAASWRLIFDINGGFRPLREWIRDIVPVITKSIPRADGDWYLTHAWEVNK